MDKKKIFTYQIAGKTYTQRPLVLGQIRQLKEHLRGIEIPEKADIMAIIDLLDDKLEKALAIVLREEGKELRDKDIDALASLLESELEAEDALRIVEDFFLANPIVSFLETVSRWLRTMTGMITGIGSKISAASSQGETSQSGTPSSGDTPSKNASPT